MLTSQHHATSFFCIFACVCSIVVATKIQMIGITEIENTWWHLTWLDEIGWCAVNRESRVLIWA